MTKLRGKWVEVNPAMWDANMDVKVNVAMGTALVEKRIAALQGVAAKQELILTTLGPTNPIVTPQQYSNTLRKLVELNGFVDVDSYFTAVPADYQPPPPAQPQVDPMVQVKMQELDFKKLNAQADQQLKMAELTLMQAKTRMEQEQKDADRAQAMQLALEEIRLKLELGMAQIEAEWKTKLAEAQLRARVETTKEIAVNNREIANNKLEHERTVAEVAVDHHHQTVEHEQKDRELDIAQQEADKPTPKPSA